MANSNRALVQATCLFVLLLLDAMALSQASSRYCDDEFYVQVYDVCSRQKRTGDYGASLSLSDILAPYRLRGVVKRSTSGSFGEDALFFSSLTKRGIASKCCSLGCTEEELAAVC